MSIDDELLRMATMVEADPGSFGVLSTGEKIAVALVLDRVDLITSAWGPILAAVDRVGPEWLAAAVRVQRLLDTAERAARRVPRPDDEYDDDSDEPY